MITFEFEYKRPVIKEIDVADEYESEEEEYESVIGKFECDEDVLTDYEFVADILEADEEPKALIRCFRAVFAGRDREYARAIGGKLSTMGELLRAAIEAAGEAAKN